MQAIWDFFKVTLGRVSSVVCLQECLLREFCFSEACFHFPFFSLFHFRGGKICMTDHFKPLWGRNVPKFGIGHAMALGVSNIVKR